MTRKERERKTKNNNQALLSIIIPSYKDPLVHKTIDDLIGKKVLGFQNASKFVGKEFSNFTKNNKKYSEVIQQVAQVNHLYKKNFDVIISDKLIFIYYSC